jgi:hypothetical protein
MNRENPDLFRSRAAHQGSPAARFSLDVDIEDGATAKEGY